MNGTSWYYHKQAALGRFVRFVARHFIEDDCIYRASALAFTTLLAIVPLIALGFVLLSTFPVFQSLTSTVQQLVLTHFVPASGEVIQHYLQVLATQVSKLSAMGVLFLLTMALLVMVTIESALNKIWRVSTARQGLSAFLLYWAIVSLAPFLLGLSVAASSYVLSLPFMTRHDTPWLIGYLPFLFSLAGFTFLYVVVPNCPVKLRHAFLGALFSALLFESAKLAFAYYLTHYNLYQLLYGALATVPVFFAWIYWVWFITLLGAEISHALSVHHERREGVPLDGFTHAVWWLYQLRLAPNRELSKDALLHACHHAYSIDADRMLQLLLSLHFIRVSQDGYYLLHADLNTLTLYDLTQQLPFPLPTEADLTNHPTIITPAWQHHLQQAHQDLHHTLAITLDKLFHYKI